MLRHIKGGDILLYGSAHISIITKVYCLMSLRRGGWVYNFQKKSIMKLLNGPHRTFTMQDKYSNNYVTIKFRNEHFNKTVGMSSLIRTVGGSCITTVPCVCLQASSLLLMLNIRSR